MDNENVFHIVKLTLHDMACHDMTLCDMTLHNMRLCDMKLHNMM